VENSSPPQEPPSLRGSNLIDVRCVAAQNASLYLKTPRNRSAREPPECPFYSGDRFLAGFPINFAQETWFAGDRVFSFGWMFDMWVAPS
jgi:hypothetical protein